MVRAVGALASALGRAFAPHFKSVAGPWWLAAHDGAADVARAAGAGWAAAFPAPPRLGAALAFARADILAALSLAARARPADLGWDAAAAVGADAGDLEERAGRARAGALRAGSALVARLAEADVKAPPGVLDEVAAALVDLLVGGGGEEETEAEEQEGKGEEASHPAASRAAKKAAARAAAAAAAGTAIDHAAGRRRAAPLLATALASPSPAVRAAACRAVAALAAAAPGVVAAAAPALTPPILQSLGDRDGSAAGPAWDAALRLTALPGGGGEAGWRALGDARRVVLPAVCSALRHTLPSAPACRGLLPLLVSAPTECLLPDGVASLVCLLEAAWAGVANGGAGAPGAAAAFREATRWGLSRAAGLGGEAAVADALLGPVSPLATRVLPAALGGGEDGAADARAAACAAIADAVRPGAPPAAWPAVLASLTATVPGALTAALTSSDPAAFEAAGGLMAAVDAAAADDASRAPGVAALAAALAAPLVAALSAAGGHNNAPPAAARLLAALIERHPAAVGGVNGGAPPAVEAGASPASPPPSGLSLAAAGEALLAAPPGPAAGGRADVVLACARAGGASGAAEWRGLVRGWAGRADARPALATLLARLRCAAAGSSAPDAASPAWRGAEVDDAVAALTDAVVSRGDPAAAGPLAALLAGAGGRPLAGEAALEGALAALVGALDARGPAAPCPPSVVSALAAALPAVLALPSGDLRPAAGAAAAALGAAAAVVAGRTARRAQRVAVAAAPPPPPSDSASEDEEEGSDDDASSLAGPSDADSLSAADEEEGGDGAGSPSSSSDEEEGGASTTAAAAWARAGLVSSAPGLSPAGRSALVTALLDRALEDADGGAATPATTAAALADAARVGQGGGSVGGLTVPAASGTLDAALALADEAVPLLGALVTEVGPHLALVRDEATGTVRAAEAAALLAGAARPPARAVLRWARGPAAPAGAGGAILAALLHSGGGDEHKSTSAAGHLIRGGLGGGGAAAAAVTSAWAGAVRAALAAAPSPFPLPPRLAAALPAAAAAFRGRVDGAVISLDDTALPALARAALAAAARLPSLAQARGARDAAGAAAVVALLATAAACYPPAAPPAAIATSAEAAALATALERQLAGERAAAAAAAVAARLGGDAGGVSAAAAPAEEEESDGEDDTTPSHSPSPSPADADTALACLTAAALQYAAPSLPPAAWPDVVRRVRAGVGAATAAAEAAAEAAAAAAGAAARGLAGPAGAAASPSDALEMLRRLASGGGPAAGVARARAAGPVSDALAGAASADAAAAEAWAACWAALDARFATSPVPLPSWPAARAEALADAARAGLALGVVDAAAAAAGGRAVRAAAAWAAARPGLAALGAAGLTAAATSPDPALAAAASAEADGWGQDETGVDAAGAALATALAGCGGPPARRAALALLTRPDGAGGLAARLVDPVLPGEDEEGGEGGGAFGGGDDSSSDEDGGGKGSRRGSSGGSSAAAARSALEAAGVRADLAAALIPAGPPTTPAPTLALLAAWGVALARLEALPPGSPPRAALGQALHDCAEDGVSVLLDCVAGLLPLGEGGGKRGRRGAAATGGRRVAALPADPAAAAAAAAAARAAGRAPDAAWTLATALAALPALHPDAPPHAELAPLAPPLFRAALRCAPASARLWFASLRNRGLAAAVERYTASSESASIIAGELAGAASVGPGSGPDAVPGWAVRTAPGAREAVASLVVEDGASLELALTLPPAWPLRPAAVSIRRAVGVPDARLRRWMLSIAAFLRAQNGGLAGGVRLWRANVGREFAGLEECMICYAIVAAGGGLPRKACRTCGKRFHGGCLYKWFRSSAKAAACPHCQAEWGV